MSQDVFQQKMDMIIEKCPWALALIDDVIKEEHDHNLQKLMETARTAGLTFNSSKCAINQKQSQIFLCDIWREWYTPRSTKGGGDKITPQPS